MGTIISWIRSTSGWVRSPFGNLPSLRVDDAPAHQTWLILAGGLALILSRASKSELDERFSATLQVYTHAHARLQKRRVPKPHPKVLRDALREIANLADPMTREAGRECLERAIDRLAPRRNTAAAAAASAAAASSLSASSLSASPGMSTQTTAASSSSEDEDATQIDLDLLFERSARLRDTVAWARSTTFGQD